MTGQRERGKERCLTCEMGTCQLVAAPRVPKGIFSMTVRMFQAPEIRVRNEVSWRNRSSADGGDFMMKFALITKSVISPFPKVDARSVATDSGHSNIEPPASHWISHLRAARSGNFVGTNVLVHQRMARNAKADADGTPTGESFGASFGQLRSTAAHSIFLNGVVPPVLLP